MAQNDPTVTQSDTNQTNEDSTLTVNAANGVLSNDSDADDTLTVATFKVAGDGTTYNAGMTAIIAGIGSITLNANGSYEFVPVADFNGDVPTITYTTNTGVSDTLDIDVAPQADPTITVSDSNQTNEDTTLTVNAVNGVLSNDSDADGPLSVATFRVFGDNTDYIAGDSVDISGIGTVTLNGDGSYEFVPFTNFSGTVPTITYTTDTGVSDTLDIDIVAVADEPNLWVVNEQKEASIDFQDAEVLLGADEDWSSDIDVSQVLGDNTLGTWYANDDNKVEIGRESIYRSGASDENLILEIEGDNGDNSIYTDISVQEGRYYSFTFDVAARRWENGDSDLDVIWVRLDDQGNPIMDEAMTLYQFRPEDNGWERDIQITLPSDMDGNYRLLVQSTDANSYGAIVDNLVLESSDARGFEDTFVDLWDLGASLADTDGSETLVVTMSGLPEGTIIKDGDDVEVVAGADGIVDITALDIATLKANVPVSGEYTVNVTATATETSNGDQASKSVELPLVIEGRGYQLKTGSFGDDVIDGTEANELIVGDVQGFQIVAGEDYNIAFILDTSGSMRNIIETAKTEIISAVGQIIDSAVQENSGMVRIMLSEFASTSQIVVELDLSVLSAEEAKSQFATTVSALNAENSTNYEGAFETAIDWFVDNGITGANNQTFFITDGEPTRAVELDDASADQFLMAYTPEDGLLSLLDLLPEGFEIDEDAEDVYFNGQLVVEQRNDGDVARIYSPYTGVRLGVLTEENGEFLFTDRWDNDEQEVRQGEHYFAILNEISNVDAIGLGSGVDIDTLVKFDSDGVVEPNIDVTELEEVILGKKTSLLPGQDEISSAGGEDILFGDGVQFDGIEEQGVAAIQKYVAQQLGELEANVYPRDLFEYIEENVAEFNLSTENDKGDDLDGGTGDDILFGQGGDDILVGGPVTIYLLVA
ncbi:T1SS secreted agglutinin RTX [Vibrio sp. JCM 19236]|nr:T1SS secreted agglutinin RTX [Vibrio sp. JCM 19236]